jgi:sugar O-acyltransferase (sialic acid O-acetyltransferase NeuD family)
MNKTLGIFGTSGMARETRDIAQELGYSTVFIAYDNAEKQAFGNLGRVILESEIDKDPDMSYVIGIGEGAVRRKIANRYAGKLKFINLIHPSATFGYQQHSQVESKQGVIICAGVRFTNHILVGDFTIFNINSTVSHDTTVGDYTTVSPQACILGNVQVQSGVWIGAGAIINQGTNQVPRIIGANTLIGSGAVVLSDCDPDATYVGVPARRIK